MTEPLTLAQRLREGEKYDDGRVWHKPIHLEAADALDRLSAELAEARKREERLLAAISWIEPPFADANTTHEELRFRVEQCVKDTKRVLSSSKETSRD